MAIKFTKVAGQAKKSNVDYMKLTDGKNRFRMVGDILPRYVYWIQKGTSTASFECLSFDRDLEKFTNIEKDWVPSLVHEHLGVDPKETKCAWAYLVQVIDRADGKLKVLGLKKKMFEKIKSVAEDLGDPTDPETGYDIIVERVKTGPRSFNVSYEVKEIPMMKAKDTPAPETDKEIIANLKNIEDLIPRATPDELKAQLEAFLTRADASEEEEAAETSTAAEKEAIDELDNL